ncbi:gamma-glutamylcyclotransferase family protein [Bacillus sp. Marseille-P3661]|uniref:gamma-glutamylcyclotransferase family protein n=1 Tax=Bacillus sp. Marseille-P3661 TaxID=1936234 RepID=UPI000C851982|nr:gamma-glutamylcyclotransferase family protein [Bacillus sp. Marseille-P3661]
MKNTFKVFVYGTLLVDESNHHVAKPYLHSVEPGIVKGFLYTVGPYPALLADPNGMEIKGEWFTVDAVGLKRMDELEGYHENRDQNYYERIIINDCYSNAEGFVYVFKEEQVAGLDLIECGSWRDYRNNK